jgi:metal-responsive CopG/Arc/MetJ family transcriptional regulator
MKMIEITIDQSLLAEIDQVIFSLNTTRSAFIREALQLALRRYKIKEMERKHAEGHARYPVQADEFDVWEGKQV